MTIAITAIAMFISVFLLSVCLGLVSVVVAFVVGKTVSPSRETCAKCIAGWRSRRGLRKRLLVIPFAISLVITLIIFVVFAVMGLADTMRIRREIIDSTRVVVRLGGNCHRKHEQERVLLQLGDIPEIRALAQRVAVSMRMPGMHCKCCGNMTFDFYQGDEIHFSFSFHHGKSIRIKGNALGDNALSATSRRELNAWLDHAGVTKALDEAQEQERLRREAEITKMELDAQQTPAGDILKTAPEE